MTTQLPDRLRELADDAPVALSAEGLWEQGRRRHRRQVAAALAVVGCLVAGLAAIGVGAWRSEEPDPSRPPTTGNGAMSMPDRFFTPNPWLPTTPSPGRLVAVLHATKNHLMGSPTNDEIVGVAAGSQQYRFLDLPGRSSTNLDVSLSPDGRHLAYWTSGPTRKQTKNGSPAVTGIAIDDLTTGRVEDHPMPSDYGLGAELLAWTDSRTLVVGSSVVTDPTGSLFEHYFARAFVVGRAAATTIHSVSGQVSEAVKSSGVFALANGQAVRVYDPGTGRLIRTGALPKPLLGAALDPAGQQIAGIWGGSQRSGPPKRLLVGRLSEHGTDLRRPPGSSRYYDVLGWSGPRHVVVADYRMLVRVDVVTGEQQMIAATPPTVVEVAANALRRGTVPAIAPPTPRNPRWIALAGLIVVCSCGGVLVARRSRGRV